MASDGWISVEERLPKEDGKVIVHCPSGEPSNPLIAMAWYHPEERAWSLIPEYWTGAISHWRALPAPPEPGPKAGARKRGGEK